MWGGSREVMTKDHADYYADFAEIGKIKTVPTDITMGENIKYFGGYQINWMYWPLFL
jgi:hypothetical protein